MKTYEAGGGRRLLDQRAQELGEESGARGANGSEAGAAERLGGHAIGRLGGKLGGESLHERVEEQRTLETRLHPPASEPANELQHERVK